MRRAKVKRPEAQIIGVTVQKMITYPNSFELIMGTKKDPIFGAVIMVGMGGIAAEVFRDRALGLPPLNEALARRIPGERIYVSLERNMKCGQGSCGHCQIGPYFICKDGAVFQYSALEKFFNVEEY